MRDIPKIQTLDLAEGRFVSDYDVSHTHTNAVIGSQIRDELFGSVEALGKERLRSARTALPLSASKCRTEPWGAIAGQQRLYPLYGIFKKYGLRRSIQFPGQGSFR